MLEMKHSAFNNRADENRGRSMENIKFHRLARAVIIKNDSILVAKVVGHDHTFLPGGHIELGESAHTALQREIREEIRIEIIINGFVGDIEHHWESEGVRHFELNHLFKVELLTEDEQIVSQGNDLSFFWVKLDEQHQYNLEPFPLVDQFKNKSIIDSYWVSTLQ
jgi:8-oxo-dGTP diphosphatase